MSNECIVIGNGPSLNDVPLNFLYKYPTFGVNQIWRKFEPTYYVAVHKEISVFAEQINALNSSKFITDKIDTIKDCQKLHSVRMGFYKKPDHGKTWYVWEGWSTIFVCLQIAYWLGFRVVLLVGLDHDKSGPFADNYYDGLPDEHKIIENKNPDKLLPAFKLAKQYYEADGRRIINLTPNTKEPVFEKGSLAEWYQLSS